MGVEMIPTIASIQRAVADHYQVPLAWMREPGTKGGRQQTHSRPRQIAIRLSALITGKHYTVIGHHFGDRNHSTIIHACRVVEKRRQSDPQLSNDMQRITLQLLRQERAE
jgi:chromosomal replication initiator protein